MDLISMNRVVVIVTEGCEACAFMQRIVAKAYNEAKIEDTSIGVYNFDEREVENLIKENNITDFPTTLFIKNGTVIDKIIGTETKEEVIEKMNKLV